MQLDALLRSYTAMTDQPARLLILLNSSSRLYRDAYLQLIEQHSSSTCTFIDETAFRTFSSALETLIGSVSTRTIFFLVDDDLFIRPINIGFISSFASHNVVPSLRLGLNITWSFTRAKRQLLPHFKRAKVPASKASTNDQMMVWKWRSGDIDWGYPGSLDGNIFQTDWVKETIRTLDYSAPNSLESGLNAHLRSNRVAWGICFQESIIVNSPINRVQLEVDNHFGSLHQDHLLEAWTGGYRMDIKRLGELKVNSAHQEIRLPLIQGSQQQ